MGKPETRHPFPLYPGREDVGGSEKDPASDRGLSLTKRQLTKRFAKWEFKKNSKQIGPDASMHHVQPTSKEFKSTGVRKQRATRGRRIDQLSSTNWASTGVDAVEPDLTPTLTAEDVVDVSTDRSTDTPTNTPPSSTVSNFANGNCSSSSGTPASIEKTNPNGILINTQYAPDASIASGAELESFIRDDTGTSVLARLFSALNVEPLISFAPLYPPFEEKDRVVEVPETVSRKQLLDLARSGIETSWKSVEPAIRHLPSKRQTESSALSFPRIDVDFPTAEFVFTDPLNFELYPFPHFEDSFLHTAIASKHHDTLHLELAECLDKINKIGIASPRQTEAEMVLLERMAVANFTLGHYHEAERYFNQVLPVALERHGANSRYVLSLKRDLADVILHLARYKEANGLALDVYNSAISIDTADGALVQKSILVLAQSYGNLHDLPKEEELLTQLVQIRLSIAGPRDGETLAAMRSLCDSLTDARHHSKSEELLRIALELSLSTRGLSDKRKCLLHRKLATVLYKQGNYGESEALYRKTVQLSEELLGLEHPDTLRCKFWLCKVLRALERHEESRILHLETVAQQIRTRGELRGSTIESMAALSVLLMEMSRVEEAENWMARAVTCSMQSGVMDSVDTMKFWEILGRLYESRGKQPMRAILDLYEEMSSEIASVIGPGSRSIDEMFKWNNRGH